MSDWSEVVKSFTEGLTETLGALNKAVLYPPGFDQQAPAYRLTWLDQQIPLYEKKLADLETRVQAQGPREIAKALLSLGQASPRQLGAQQQAIMDQIKLETTREQVIELKAQRAAVALLAPKPALPMPAKPTRQQQIDGILADIAQVNAECTRVCATITDQTLRDQITLAYEDRARKLYEQVAKL